MSVNIKIRYLRRGYYRFSYSNSPIIRRSRSRDPEQRSSGLWSGRLCSWKRCCSWASSASSTRGTSLGSPLLCHHRCSRRLLAWEHPWSGSHPLRSQASWWLGRGHLLILWWLLLLCRSRLGYSFRLQARSSSLRWTCAQSWIWRLSWLLSPTLGFGGCRMRVLASLLLRGLCFSLRSSRTALCNLFGSCKLVGPPSCF